MSANVLNSELLWHSRRDLQALPNSQLGLRCHGPETRLRHLLRHIHQQLMHVEHEFEKIRIERDGTQDQMVDFREVALT